RAKNLLPPNWLCPHGKKTNPPLLVLKPRRSARLPQQTRQWSASAPLPPFPALWLQPLVLPGHAQDRGEAAHRPAAVPPRPTRRLHRRLRFEGRGPPRLRGLSHLHRSRLLRPKSAAVVPLFASLQLPGWPQVAPVLAETPQPPASSRRLDQRPFAKWMSPAFSQIGYIEVPKCGPFRLLFCAFCQDGIRPK